MGDSLEQIRGTSTAAGTGSLRLRVALVGGSVAVTLVVLELIFRTIMPTTTHHLMYQESPDTEIGVELVPGAEFAFEGVTIPIPPTQVQISNQGLRDIEHMIPKPEGEQRLVCLGDSTTFGWGVEMEDGFCARLNSLLGAPWTTVNLGVPGYNSSQEVRRLETVGLAFSPDIVLVLFDGNDYQPPLDYGGANSWLTWLSDRMALVRWIRKRLRGGGGAPEDTAHHDAGHAAAHTGQEMDAPHGPKDAVGGDASDGNAWKGKAKVLEAFTRLADLGQQHGFQVLVLMPNEDEDQDLRRLLDRRRIPYASIRPALWGKPEDVLIPEDQHPNAEGHRRIAALAARVLRERGVISAP